MGLRVTNLSEFRRSGDGKGQPLRLPFLQKRGATQDRGDLSRCPASEDDQLRSFAGTERGERWVERRRAMRIDVVGRVVDEVDLTACVMTGGVVGFSTENQAPIL